MIRFTPFFITFLCFIFPLLILLSDKMAKSWAFFLTSWLVPPPPSRTNSFPWHSHPWPKGDPCCTDTLFLSDNLNPGALALHETGRVLSRARTQTPAIPLSHLVMSSVSRWVRELKAGGVCGRTVIVITVWEGCGFERENDVLVTEAVPGGWLYCPM